MKEHCFGNWHGHSRQEVFAALKAAEKLIRSPNEYHHAVVATEPAAHEVDSKKEAKGIILTSQRGTRVDEERLCDRCFKEHEVLWRYAESTQGTVHLCGVCKIKVYERSFGSVDALNMSVSGGGFETSKRRH